jgi:uncharacterized membrane protein (Fun14 family)
MRQYLQGYVLGFSSATAVSVISQVVAFALGSNGIAIIWLLSLTAVAIGSLILPRLYATSIAKRRERMSPRNRETTASERPTSA